jgi:hypothetical protein
MKSYTIEIETDLNELVSSAIEEVKRSIAWLVSEGEIEINKIWLDGHKNPKSELFIDADSINEMLEYDGTKHEIIDGSVPVYTAQLKTLMFVHEFDLMEAFNNAGICTVDEVLKNPDSYILGLEGVAIFCYIEQEVNEWINDDLEDWFFSKFGGGK